MTCLNYLLNGRAESRNQALKFLGLFFFFLNLLLIGGWLQCYFGFCCTSTWRSLFIFSFLFLLFFVVPLWEKAMAPHSSALAWKIPWTEEPGGLQSMGSWRIGHDWATSLSLFTFMHWRRKWQPTPVFLPGESHGRRSLVGFSPWGRTESDTTEAT